MCVCCLVEIHVWGKLYCTSTHKKIHMYTKMQKNSEGGKQRQDTLCAAINCRNTYKSLQQMNEGEKVRLLRGFKGHTGSIVHARRGEPGDKATHTYKYYYAHVHV